MSDRIHRCRLCSDIRLESTLVMDPAPSNNSGVLKDAVLCPVVERGHNTSVSILHRRRAKSRTSSRGLGAGGTGIASLTAVERTDPAYVSHSDRHKQGKRLPGAGELVVPPSHLAKDQVSATILTALAYREPIINTVRREMRFGGRSLVLGEALQMASEAAA